MRFEERYREAFSHVTASPTLREELLNMTENTGKTRKPKKFILRRLAVAAAVTALAFALAMGANAATGGELYEITVGKLLATVVDDEGHSFNVYQGETPEGSGAVMVEGGGSGEGTIEVHIPEDGDENEIQVKAGEDWRIYRGEGDVSSSPEE